MNFLGHLSLSGFNEELSVGNFIADEVKGKKYEKYPHKIQSGIILHRKIDEFTDTHKRILDANKLIAQDQGKFAPILMDMFLDYFLAIKFKKFFDIQLKIFQKEIFKLLDQQYDIFPENIKIMYYYMKKGEWLVSYQTKDGLTRSLKGLSRRIKYENNIDQGIITLNKFEAELEEIFEEFYPEIQNHCDDLIQNRFHINV